MIRRLMLNSFKKSGHPTDTDSIAYITAIESTGIVLSDDYKSAIKTFFTALKTAGLYDRIYAIYPFIGGTAASHKFNAVNPLDADSSYRLSFINSPTHDGNGVTFNGTNNYADTFLVGVPGVDLTVRCRISLTYYSRTEGDKGVDMGVEAGKVMRLGISLGGTCYNEVTDSAPSFPATYSKKGLFTTSKIGENAPRNFYINGTLYRADAVSGYGGNTSSFFIGCESNAGTPQYFSARNCGYAGIESGFSEAEALSYYNAIQTLQIALGRNI